MPPANGGGARRLGPPAMRRALKIGAHALAAVAVYLALSGALFLGLQWHPAWGSVALLAAIALAGGWIYFGFVRPRRKVRR